MGQWPCILVKTPWGYIDVFGTHEGLALVAVASAVVLGAYFWVRYRT